MTAQGEDFLALAASHSFTVLSSLAEARRRPSGLNATPMTPVVWPRKVSDFLAGVGVPEPHRAVLLAEARRRPSGLNATPLTHAG